MRSRVIDRQDIDALLFDLDGVVTQTATVHAATCVSMETPPLARGQGGTPRR